jgi:hypothetical protein
VPIWKGWYFDIGPEKPSAMDASWIEAMSPFE